MNDNHKLIFRLANEIQIPRIMEIIWSASHHMQEKGIDQWDEVYPNKETVLKDIKNQDLYVALRDDRIVAIVVLNQESDESYDKVEWRFPKATSFVIHRLCVDPAYQGRGIAREVMCYCMWRLRTIGAKSIRLDVFSKNPEALALYENLGFEIMGYANYRKGKFYLLERGI